jgi:hypothetical protein
MIDWNAVTAIGTAMTAAVVGVTAIFGFDQLRQLRRATQLDGAMRILSDLNSPSYLEARQFVATELHKSLDDPRFRKEVELGAIETANPDVIHHEQAVLRTFEAIGSIVQQGLLDHNVVVNATGIAILVAWEHLSPVVEIQRRTIHPRMWENFEHLHDQAKTWFIERGSEEQHRAWHEAVTRHHIGIAQTAQSASPVPAQKNEVAVLDESSVT